jgi:subtilisin family serine protease
MQVHFIRPDRVAGSDEPDGFGTVGIPKSSLERHGGRVLDPSQAAQLPDTVVRSTVYRWRFLLVPDDLLQDGRAVGVINDALEDAGLELVAPAALGQTIDVPERYLRYLRTMPRTAELTVRAGRAATIDAWTALQRLRAVATSNARLDEIVSRISLDHLLSGSTQPTPDGPPTQGIPDTGDLGQARLGRRGDNRIPVDLFLAMPGRPGIADPGVERRVQVAVLDTGIAENPHLGVSGPPGNWGGDDFVTVDHWLQEMIRGELVAKRLETIPDYWERPASGRRLVDDLDSHIGHGTFIAGIVRQIAPDTQVRAIRVMYSDGIVASSALVSALTWLRARLDDAEQTAAAGGQVDPASLVDVVSLSLGGYLEAPLEQTPHAPLIEAVDALTARGVFVVAGAGNDSTRRPFYPAALAGRPRRPDTLPVVSVGAFNPNVTKAGFSNDGYWVTCWASGVNVASTVPMWLSGDRTPALRAAPGAVGRETLDPDNFSTGWAIWSGSSFATPLAAATIAGELQRQDGALSLHDVSADARRRRALAVLEYLEAR